MSFTGNLRVLGSLAALLLMAGIQGGHLDGDLQEICEYCQMDDLMACNDSAIAQIDVTVNCESTKESCILGVGKTYDDPENFTMTTIGPNQVCLLRSDSAIDQTTPTIANQTDNLAALNVDESMVTTADVTTIAVSTSSSEALDYPADQAAEPLNSFRSEDVAEAEKLSPSKSETIECFACKSSLDEACLGDVDKLKPVKCSAPSECITVVSGGNLIRNCSSAFPADDLALCQKPDNITCKLCQTANCNKLPWNRCYRCSSNDDPNCAFWSAPKSVPVQICADYNDVCSVRVTKDGDTVRECSHPHTKCPKNENCFNCGDALCNAGVFPLNRTRCIQCQDCEAEQDPKSALPCKRYSPEEKCFSYVTAKSKMIRGCVSNAEEMHQCQASGPKCVTCTGRDGCNSMPLMKDTNLSCYKCNSKEDASCAWAQVPKTAVKCQNKVLYYLEETCMMEFDPESKLAVRACSFDHGACTPKDENCRTCTGDGCNAGNLKVQECIQCSSDHPGQANCSKLAEGMSPTKCPQEIQPYQSRGCFTMTKGNTTVRGCVVGLSAEDLKFCKLEGQSQCNLCLDDGCNNRRAPSRGGKTFVMSVLMWILTILLVVVV